MRKIKPWLGSAAGTILVGLAILFFLAATAAWAQAPQAPSGKPETAKAPVTPPPGPKTERGVCQVKIECPPIKTPGKTVCTATIDCPPAKETKDTKEKK